MNSGVIANEWPEIGLPIWQTTMELEEWPVIYAPRYLETGLDDSAEVWLSNYERTVGVLDRQATKNKFDPDLREPVDEMEAHNRIPYARYAPQYDQQFLNMCRQCSGNHAEQMLVVPASVADETAMNMLLNIEERRYGLMFELSENKRKEKFGKILHLVELTSPWIFHPGLFYKSFVTVMLTTSPELCNAVVEAGRSRSKGYQVLETW